MTVERPSTFAALPPGSRIPASPVRVVALQRSSNVASIGAPNGGTRDAVAYLATLYLLKGTYALYAWLQYEDHSGGVLAGGLEVPVTAFARGELDALQWLAGNGFDMRPVDLHELEVAERISALAALPFAHQSDLADEGVPGIEPEPAADSLLDVLADTSPRDAVRQLRALLLTG